MWFPCSHTMIMSAYISGYIVHTWQRKAYESAQQKEWTRQDDSMFWTMRSFFSGSINANKEWTISSSILLGVGDCSLHIYIYIYMELQPQFLASVLWRCLKKYCCLAHGKRQCLKCYNGLVYPYSCAKHGFVVGFFCWIVSPFFLLLTLRFIAM